MANDEIAAYHSEEEIEIIDTANELSSRIDAKLRALSPSSPARKIFKVHPLLRNVNAEAFEPHVLAIGPYHRSNNQLSAMEEHKLRYLKELLERRGENNTKKYVSFMWQLEEEARACYVDSVDLTDDEFVEMMLLDTCFIVELFRKTIRTEIRDPIVGGWMTGNVARDLLLVENQLPFFVLNKFFDMTRMSNENSLYHMIFQFFTDKNLTTRPFPKDEGYCIQLAEHSEHLPGLLHRNFIENEIDHHSEMDTMDLQKENSCRFSCELYWNSKILNWICKWFCLCSKIDSGNLTEKLDERFTNIPCATELNEAGIKFKKVDSDNLLAVQFKDGIMEIPTLRITDNSESFFRNLIAYEQLKQIPTMYYVTDYIRLMDCLVNTSKDVELLCECGIIDNRLGDYEAVAKMFNSLGDNVCFSPFEKYKYRKIFQEVKQHCNRICNKWKADLWRKYNTPWAVISFFAALLLLLLTATQTVFSVLAFIKPK